MARLTPTADVAAGLTFVATALLALVAGSQLPIGTPAQMGSGFVPIVLGTALLLLGTLISARAWRRPAPRVGPWAWRPLATVLGATLLFASLISAAGLLLAAFVTVVAAGLAAERGRLQGLVAFAAGLSILVTIIFVGLLGLPIDWLP